MLYKLKASILNPEYTFEANDCLHFAARVNNMV